MTAPVVLTQSEQFLRDHPEATWQEKRDAETAQRAADDAERKRDKLDAALVFGDNVLRIPKPEPLVPGLLDVNSLAILYGASGSGKSFVALDIALRVATGEPWQSKHIGAAPVLYIAAEGIGGTGIRVEAWQSQYKVVPPLDGITFSTKPVNLFDTGWTDALVSLVRRESYALVVIDTLARSMNGGDENSARDIAIVVENLERVRDASRGCVLLVHHTGYDGTHARGSTALRAAADTELEIKGSDGSITLTATKQKNAEDRSRWYLKLEARELSMVVVNAAGSRDAVGTNETETMRALMVSDDGLGLTASEWLLAVDIPKSTFMRHRADLARRELIRNVGSDKRPRWRVSDAGLAMVSVIPK